MNADDRYVVISADCHGGGEIHELPRLPRVAVPRRVRRLGRRRSRSCTPTCSATSASATGTPTGAMRDLEADGVVAEVIFPNTIPPFFPAASLVDAAARRPTRTTSSCGGPGCRRTTAGSPTSARRTPGRRAGIAQIMLHDVDARGRGDPLGARRNGLHRRRPPPRRAARRRAAPAATRTRLRADLVGVRGARHAGQPPQRQRGARPRRHVPGGHRDVPARGHVVGAQRAHPPHLRRRAGTPPRPAVRVHRAGHRVGARLPGPARLLLRPHAATRSARRRREWGRPSSRSCR